MRSTIICVRCHRERKHGGRRLCTSCFILTGPAPHGDGTRDQYPRTVRPREHTVEDYEFLRSQGLDHNEIAVKLGRTPDHLRGLMKRAKDEVSTR